MSINQTRFCLNRIICPRLNLEEFFKLTQQIGLTSVELRNDLPGSQLIDTLTPTQVNELAKRYNIRISTINAVQKFNLATAAANVDDSLEEMLQTAVSIRCQSIVLCPNNDTNDRRSSEQCYQETVTALARIAPVLKSSDVIGLVEPLGFEESSLRSKNKAIQAIQDSGFDDIYRLVHDTFHHFLAPQETIPANKIGMVHISGVESQLPKEQIRDEHRVLIGPDDMLNTKEQLDELERNGYSGMYSFEPFSSHVQQLPFTELMASIQKSIAYLTE